VLGDLSRLRRAFYQCLTTRADALFELIDAALCAEGPITSLVELSLATEHRRGHGSLYDGLNQSRIEADRLRTVLAGPTPSSPRWNPVALLGRRCSMSCGWARMRITPMWPLLNSGPWWRG
jgi:hypothetical protein